MGSVRPIVSNYIRPTTAVQMAQWSAQSGSLVLAYDATNGRLTRQNPPSSEASPATLAGVAWTHERRLTGND